MMLAGRQLLLEELSSELQDKLDHLKFIIGKSGDEGSQRKCR